MFDRKEYYNKNKDKINEQRRVYEKESRKWLKEHHYCKECHRQDAYTLSGRTLCADCTYKQAKRKRNKIQNNAVERQKNIDRHREWAEKKRENGYCTYCGKRKADNGYATCFICRNKLRIKQAERRAKATTANYPRGENGYCYLCNKQMAMVGSRYCQDCRNKVLPTALDNLEKAKVALQNKYKRNIA